MSKFIVNNVPVYEIVSKKGTPMYLVGNKKFSITVTQSDASYSMRKAVMLFRQAHQRAVEADMVRSWGFDHDAPYFHETELSRVEHRQRNAKAKGGKHFD